MKTEEEILVEKLRRQFNKGCTEFGLLEDGDRILIALSGGKDSLLLTRLLAERSRIFRPSISVEAAHVIMDNIPYETERTYLEQYCRELNVPLTILHTGFDQREGRQQNTPCLLCSRYRRRALLDYATERGFNKVALGHHQDDLLVTLLMNLTYEGRADTMRPSVPLEHFPVTIIRPMCRVEESLVARYAVLAGLMGQKVPCPYDHATQRSTMTGLLRQLEEITPEARHNLWHAVMGESKGARN